MKKGLSHSICHLLILKDALLGSHLHRLSGSPFTDAHVSPLVCSYRCAYL